MTATPKNELSSLAKAIPLFATNYRSFTKADFILANFIAQNYQDFLHMTILDLAKATSLSEITISRFCKKLSLAGVQALKIQLSYLISEEIKIIAASFPKINHKQYDPKVSNINPNLPNTTSNADATATPRAQAHLYAPNHNKANTTQQSPSADNDANNTYHSISNNLAPLNSTLHTTSSNEAANLGAILGAQLKTFTLNDSLYNIGTQIFATLTAGLNQTLNLIDFAAVERATNIINNSSRLMLFGYGNSSVVCKDLGTRFVRFGFSCEIVSDLHQQITLASVCDSNTTIIVVSYTGSSLHLDEVLKIARQRGAKIILFTSYKNSAIAKQADAILIGVCPELKDNTEASLSRLIYMAIGDIIYTRLTLLRNQPYHDNLQQIRSALAILKS